MLQCSRCCTPLLWRIKMKKLKLLLIVHVIAAALVGIVQLW
jgi:hypothetical protein